MDTTSSLAKKLAHAHPSITFTEATTFSWDPNTQQITYNPAEAPAFLLHELGHALLEHQAYARDVELLSIERAAWVYAKNNLAESWETPISDDLIEETLDTYREWLHARSTCPECGLNGLQIKNDTYQCIHCHAKWSVNAAKDCQLRRYRHK